MTLHILAPDDPALQAVKATLTTDFELDIIPFADYRTRLDAVLNTERASHEVVYVPGHLWIPELADAGGIRPLDDLLPPLSAEFDAYQPETILPVVADDCRFNKQQFVIPLFSDGHILFYDPELVTISGQTVAPVVLPALIRSTRVPAGKHAVALKAHPSEIFLDFLPYLLSAGGRILDSDGKPAFNTASGIKALENYIGLKAFAPPDTHLYGNEDIARALKTGTVAMAITWGGQAAPILLAEGSVAAQTYKTIPLTTPWNTTWGAAIPANLPEEVQRAAIASLLKLHTPSLDVAVITAAGSPVRSTSYNDSTMAQYPWLTTQKHMLDHAMMLPKLPSIGGLLETFYNNVYQAFIGEKSAADALRDVEIAMMHHE